MPQATGQSLARQLSDGSPDGTIWGQSPTDPIVMYGGNPVAQPSGPAQAAASRGNAAGVCAVFHTAQSPVGGGVAANTSAQGNLTVQSGTGGTMLIASGDLLFVNKPTAQAGLGYGNVYPGSAGNLADVTFTNVTSGSITPTGSENYAVVALRGLSTLKLTATLSPAAVASASTVEQQFAVTGLPAGFLVQVNKPTGQTGLDIGGCRVVSNNVLGITFVNPTSAAITPTSAEVYNIVALPGLDAVNNDVFYGINIGVTGSQTVGMVVASSGTSNTLTGLATTDSIVSIYKPTIQAAATSSGVPVAIISAANTLGLYYQSTGSWTPTSSEVYGVRTTKIAPVAPLGIYNPSLAPASVAANTCAEQTFTVTGLISASAVWINKPSWTSGLAILGVRISATNTLAINFANLTSSAIVPPAESYLVGNFQAPLPGAGNVVYQTVMPTLVQLGNLANSLRSALGSSGINAIAGA